MKTMLKLALPVVGSYLGLMLMQLVDLLSVGRVSATAVGAVGLGSSVFAWAMMFGIGMLAGLDYVVSRAYGARKGQRGFEALVQALLLSLALAIPFTVILVWLSYHLDALGVNPEVVPEAAVYLRVLVFSLWPAWLFTAVRQYLQAIGRPGPGFAVMAGANVLNAVCNYVFVFGHFGFPALGAEGAAFSTLASRSLMALSICAWAVAIDRRTHEQGFTRQPIPLWVPSAMRELVKLGFPAAMQMTFEVGVFAFATALAARLATEQMAAHQIVLNLASIAFMVPLGLSSATAVLVGQALGRDDPHEAFRMGNLGISLATGFMTLSCIVMLSMPDALLSIYTTDPAIVSAGKAVLLVAGLFQIFDGVQASAAGALRGLGQTRVAAIANLVGHWCVGLPVGAYLCFQAGKGLLGLWIGLSLGLIVVAIVLILQWRREGRGQVIQKHRLDARVNTERPIFELR